MLAVILTVNPAGEESATSARTGNGAREKIRNAGATRVIIWLILPDLSVRGHRRLIDTARIFGEIIPGESVSARAGAAANFVVLADAALAFPVIGIAQNAEEAGVAIHADHRVFEHVAGGHRQKTAGIDLTSVRDEDETAAVADAGSSPNHAARVDRFLSSPAFRFHALGHITAVVHGFGGFHVKRSDFGDLVHEFEDALVLLGGEIVIGERAACHHEEEQAPHARVRLGDALGYLPELVHVPACDRCLKLRVERDIARMAKGEHGPIESSRDAAET